MDKKLAIKLRKFNRVCPIAGYKEESIKVGSSVIVLTDRGEEFGTIVSFLKHAPKQSSDVRLKKVLRYATEEDLKIVNNLSAREEKAREIAVQKAREYELPIKIIGVEYLFDSSKINIYYKLSKENKTSDMKPYRKDLSSSLNAEATLRSVTARDEARFMGGLGPCGRALCCASWLEKPMHVTVKMVKDQGIQISPTKTSGICGRLMCCFNYEREPAGKGAGNE